MKFKTVREGERAILWNNLGEGRLVVGPERVFLCFDRLEFQRRYTANQFQYLVVKDSVGHVTHKPGPCEMFMNPLEYENITVREAIRVKPHHLIVVYKAMADDKQERRIVDGPIIFMPEANEWLHHFVWHGQDKEEEGHLLPRLNQFFQVASIPQQFYYNVSETRTLDETMITVRLMLFYELSDILTMLETTHDPIADMINAVCADIISFAGKVTYENFLRQTEKLSDLNTYPQLIGRAARMGFNIQKVAYRGYFASDQMQAMHDTAIKSRTQLRLDAEVEEQKQRLVDYKLKKEQARTEKRQEMDKNKEEHRQKIEQVKQQHSLYIQDREHTEKLEREGLQGQADLDVTKSKNEQRIEYLSQLKDLGVDMTKYLVNQQPPAIAEEYRVV